MNLKSILWTIRMAWRDSRSNRKKLFLFMAAIIVGVAAQVSISSFRDNLNESVNSQAKELLGADLEVEKNSPYPDKLQSLLDSLGGLTSEALEFSSMAYFPESGATRLSQITALQGDFPYYGELQTDPVYAAATFQDNGSALVDQAVMRQFGIAPGDSVKVGLVTYKIEGALIKAPGQSGASSFLGPAVYIPREGVENTGLLQRGSRLEYVTYFKFPDGTDMAAMEERLDDFRDNENIRFGFDTVRERKEEIGEAITYLSNFLNLIGFIALLLGGIGIASSIFVYIRQKIDTVAILRCVGVSSAQAVNIYLIQASGMGLIGALTGTLLGVFIQYYFPSLVSEFIPVDIELFISWPSVLTGLLTGLVTALLFAMIPLLAVKKISPLYTLRSVSVNLIQLLGKKNLVAISLVIALFVTAYAWWMLNSILAALAFTGGLLLCLLILVGFSKLIMNLTRKFIKAGWSYEWRQGLANLYRPNNQTTTLLLTFGLGVTLISAIFLTQDMLLGRIDLGDQENLPNVALYDIQYDQNEGVNEIIRDMGMEVIQNVPVVTMRLSSINGRTVTEIMADTNRRARGWALNREYRSTYRDSLIDSETLAAGEWIPSVENLENPVPISVEQGQMEDLNTQIGDTLTWNVQGVPIQSYIASTREVDWERPQPNFFVVFPKGVLESAPQFYATTVNTPDRQSSIALQQQIVREYPNVSAIDIGQLINTIRDIVNKITLVIQFIGLFSIITGLIVLAGSSATSRFQRIRETVLLRTLGADKKQVVKIQIIEYILLGLTASFTGLLLSVGTSYLLAYFYFDITFVPDFGIIAAEIVILVGLVSLIGLLNTRGIHNRPPLQVLRAETI